MGVGLEDSVTNTVVEIIIQGGKVDLQGAVMFALV